MGDIFPMPCTHTFLTIHDSTRTPPYLTIHTRSPPPPPRLAVKVYVSLFTHTAVRPPTRGATWRHACEMRDECADSSTARRHRTTEVRRIGRRARGRRARPRIVVVVDRVESSGDRRHPSKMKSSRRCVAAAVVAIVASALVAAPLGADARHSNVRTKVKDDKYNTPGYDGTVATQTQGRCAYPQTSTNYFDTFGPDFCRGVSTAARPSGASCDLSGQNICAQYTWEYKNYKYNVLGEEFTLPEPFTGIPRVDPRNNKEYVGQLEFSADYIAPIIGQALPGVVIATLLLVSMILVAIFYLLSSVCKCCGLCRCCFRPVPYTRKALHVAKGIQLLFVLLCFCGCIVIYVKSPDLGDGIKSITSGLSTSASQVVSDVESLSQAQTTVYGGGSSGDFSSELDTFLNTAKDVQKEIMNTENLIDSRRKDVQTAADIVAGVLLGVAFVTMALSILNFWRLLIIFSVLTSIILILTWIVVGVVSAFGVFLDDFCVTIDQYLIDPASVNLTKEIPCLSPSELIKFGSEWRSLISITVHALNQLVANYNTPQNSQNKLDYVCPRYESQELGNLCGPKSATYGWGSYNVENGDWVSPRWSDEYSNYVCEQYYQGTLTDDNSNALVDTSKVWPMWDCTTAYSNYSIVDTSGNLVNNVANAVKSTKKIGDTDLGAYYRNVAGAADLISSLSMLASLDETYDSLLKCEFVSTILASIAPGCSDTVDAIQMLWRGFIVTAVGYLCLWITMLVTIGRMANADLMIDGGKFDAQKAGLV